MKRALLLVTAFCAVSVVAAAGAEKGTKYGEGVKLATSVKVADLLATPADYIGKTVRVDGIVRGVCQAMGCWIQIADDEKSHGIQFKVDDGVIVFPKDAKGRRASAEGTFETIGEDSEDAAAESKDAAPKYRIKATGAIIYE